MYLSDIFDYLTNGELSQHVLGGAELGVIDASNYHQVISNVNAGILELYKRFPLLIKKASVSFVADTTDYTVNYPDLLLIEKILAEDATEYAFNESDNKYSILLMAYNQLYVPLDLHDYYLDQVNDTTFVIQYKARPTLLDKNPVDPAVVEVPLPDQYTEALLNYVTYRIFAGINANNPDTVNYYNKFESACALLRNAGTFNKESALNLRLENNGWL